MDYLLLSLFFSAVLLIHTFALQSADHHVEAPFSPRQLPQRVATCQALNRAADKIEQVQISEHTDPVFL